MLILNHKCGNIKEGILFARPNEVSSGKNVKKFIFIKLARYVSDQTLTYMLNELWIHVLNNSLIHLHENLSK